MTEDDQRLAMIRSNARFAIEELGKLNDGKFGLDRDSVAWTEGYIERQRTRLQGEAPSEALISVLGSFLGEAIIAGAGGHWIEDDNGGVGIEFQTGDRCYPLGKVAKQFDLGLEAGESILSFYNIAVDFVAKGKLASAGKEQSA
jgi:hypothetical protein